MHSRHHSIACYKDPILYVTMTMTPDNIWLCYLSSDLHYLIVLAKHSPEPIVYQT
jgi:hypothetical protein